MRKNTRTRAEKRDVDRRNEEKAEERRRRRSAVRIDGTAGEASRIATHSGPPLRLSIMNVTIHPPIETSAPTLTKSAGEFRRRRASTSDSLEEDKDSREECRPVRQCLPHHAALEAFLRPLLQPRVQLPHLDAACLELRRLFRLLQD